MDNNESKVMEEGATLTENVEKIVEKFFEDRTDTFTRPEEKAIFMVGALVNYLLYVQRDERGIKWGEEPFRSKLYGLILDEAKIKKIFGKAVGKLAEYRRSYPTLEKIAGKYLSEAGTEWKLSKDEISYYFTLGLTLGGIFRVKEKKITKKEVMENECKDSVE